VCGRCVNAGRTLRDRPQRTRALYPCPGRSRREGTLLATDEHRPLLVDGPPGSLRPLLMELVRHCITCITVSIRGSIYAASA
jgi:hypothetical protein